MADGKFDVIIIGGAVMGSAAAFWLTRLAGQGLKVLVLEADPSYARASTALSVASIRQQFSTALNVKISRYGIEFIRNIRNHAGPEGGVSDLGLIENGYLFLAGSAEKAALMAELQQIQRAEGAATELLDRAELAARFPWLALDDVVLGSFGPRDEGWFDNMGLMGALKSAARAGGVRFRHARVCGLSRRANRVTGVTLEDGTRLRCSAVINAAGTSAAAVLRMLGEVLPVEPRKRTVFLIDAPKARHRDAPLLVDHTGFYLRPEGDHWICATVPDGDGPADPEDFEPDHHLFEDVIWERLHARAPGFDAIKVLRSWAGHYAYNTLDQNAIVGRWPGLDNLYLMNGFSGHGLQQAPAIGRGIAELITGGAYRSLDLSPLGPDRIGANRPFLEKAVV
ncbi:FAD-binding oxidoreductase [Actibacterium sp. MT2.3-13A]|uniref:NAD(P)/FAD-dependent oxidoreductase n=1 Tax=Actibacterium sp. MT2.3-13A TaxID=2828332 RepID=UPI001BAC1860|nr:FAD-binding oxidoreductase [Actibacterium sp. MT2.3-13A]